MADNVNDLRTADVAADILNVIVGHVVTDYFSDNSPVSYDANTRDRGDEIEVIAEDNDGNTRSFIVSVREG